MSSWSFSHKCEKNKVSGASGEEILICCFKIFVQFKKFVTVYFNYFDSYKKWLSCVQCLSVLDVLISMSQCSQCGEGVMCRPQIEPPTGDTQVSVLKQEFNTSQ